MGGLEVQVSWLTECTIKDGQREAFDELMAEMVASTQHEPGTLSYEWYLAEDGALVHLYERFTDSTAAVAHLESFLGTFARRFVGCVEVKRFTVYGSPDDAARAALVPLGGKQIALLGGFVR